MRDTIGMSVQLANQAMRAGWYYGLSRLLERQARAAGVPPSEKPQRPVPTFRELLAELSALLLDDAKAVRDGIYPPMPEASDGPAQYLARVQAMLRDLPSALSRRAAADTQSARTAMTDINADLPGYYTQDFHFQTGGYLTEESARIYDVQLETLFMGAGGPMRRRALRAICEAVRGRDQRQLHLLDVACGTGRFLRQVRLALPRIALTGLDLSAAYLEEGQRQFSNLKPAHWLQADAERIPLHDASQDIITCLFLFHELPPEVRRSVAGEMARILKPGGRLIFMDSLQMGDKPGWDGLLEAFPLRFHEPYYRQYAIDDLDRLFGDAGLFAMETATPFLSKLMVRQKL